MMKCPFCGAEVDFSYPYLMKFDEGSWNFHHSCTRDPNKLSVVISIYGDTKEEVMEKWNGVYYAKEQTSESV